MAAKSNIIPTGKAKAKKLPKKASRAGNTGPKPAPETDGEVEVVAEAPGVVAKIPLVFVYCVTPIRHFELRL